MGGYGGGMGGYGGGMYGSGMRGMMGPGGGLMPGDPNGGPPSAWQALLGTINGAMMFFGRLSFLVDENAHAVHFFISALLQLLDKAGSLYGELARFVLRILFRRKAKTIDGLMADQRQIVGRGQPGNGGLTQTFGIGPQDSHSGGALDTIWANR